jgi:hypothetical protein
LWSEKRLADWLTLIGAAIDQVSKVGLVVPQRHPRLAKDMPLFD